MNEYFPFLNEKKEKEPELIPLQIEKDHPLPELKKNKEEKEERGVIIIEVI